MDTVTNVLAFIGLLACIVVARIAYVKAKRAYQRWLIGPPEAWLSLIHPEWRYHLDIRTEMEQKAHSLIELDIFYEDAYTLWRQGLIEKVMRPLDSDTEDGKPMLHFRLTRKGNLRRIPVVERTPTLDQAISIA